MDRALHPNLARVAASYDEVLAELGQGRITEPEARRRVEALVARDDNGLEWSIDPHSGQWQYRTLWGDLVLGDPPAFGVVGLTPAALGVGNRHNRDERITFFEVDQEALHTPGSLWGATRAKPAGRPGASKRFVLVVAVLTVAAVALLAALL